MKKQLFFLLNGIATLSPELQEHILSILQYRKYLKGEYILREGMICGNIYFLESGLIRIFNRLTERETTSWFLKENDFFISVSSFFRQQPSYENIAALEDCACWTISYEQLIQTCQLFPEFKDHRIAISDEYYCRSEERKYKILSQSPEDRYAFLVEQETELLGRVPINLLSSYLDLPPRTFDRIRSNYNNKRKGI